MKLVAYVAVSAIIHLPFLGDECEPRTVEVVVEEDCCHRMHPPESEPEPDEIDPPPFTSMKLAEPRLTREMAIEAARTSGMRTRPRPWPREVVLQPPRPTELELAPWPVAYGGLERRVVRRFVRYHAHEIARCNHAQLDRVPITVELEIRPDGAVTRATATGGDAPVASCVASAIRAIEFPRSREATTVTYSMTLRPHVERTLGCPETIGRCDTRPSWSPCACTGPP